MYEIAHRGYAGVAPENTVAAVRAACGRGTGSVGQSVTGDRPANDQTVDESDRALAHGVEVDVRPRADGTPVVFHDERLDAAEDSRGITDSDGFVRDADPQTLTDADVLESGEGVPTLDAVADVVPPNVELHVELKSPGSEDVRLGLSGPGVAVWRPFVERVHAVTAGHDIPVTYASFFDGALEAAQEVAPATSRAALCLDPDRGLTRAREFNCRALNPSLNVLDAALVSRAHRDGRTVNVWTVRNWQQAARCHGAGADGIISDYPGLHDHLR